MRAYELLYEDQILTELDWSVLKKGIAAGLISLSTLGVNAKDISDFDSNLDIKRVDPAQAVEIVKDKYEGNRTASAKLKQYIDQLQDKLEKEPKSNTDIPKKTDIVKPEIKKDKDPTPSDIKKTASNAEKKKDFDYFGYYYQSINKFKMTLKDGDSAKFKDVKIVRSKQLGDMPIVVGLVNAKNSFGAYTGWEQFVATTVISGTSETLSDFSDFWNNYVSGNKIVWKKAEW